MSLPRPCLGCGKVIPSGSRCESCTPVRPFAPRGSTSGRGYGAAYQRNRRIMIEEAWATGRPCVLCGHGFATKADITAEHIRPVRAGGTHDLPNLAPAHAGCNTGWNRGRRAA